MSLNSLSFAIFLAFVVVAYFSVGLRLRWVILLFASYFFYGLWKIEYLLLLCACTLANYLCALKIDKWRTQSNGLSKAYLVSGILFNILLLLIFKYMSFFYESFRYIFGKIHINYAPLTLQVMTPIGISFYVLKSISYIIDVYRGQIEAERHLGFFAVYVSFFPQILSGPIERARNFLPQLKHGRPVEFNGFTEGLKLILWGTFKKTVIADRLGLFVNQIYSDPYSYHGTALIIALYFFAFEIYCDFSGYSDIAIGTARLLGYETIANFRQPYFSRSITEFWRRWHMSLSFWFRDYLYIPLGGSKCSKRRHYFNLFVVFLISGLWHGVGWTFIVWGIFHGIWRILSEATQELRSKMVRYFTIKDSAMNIFRVLICFHLTCLGWVFFRADSLKSAVYIIRNLSSNIYDISWFSLRDHGFDFAIALPSVLLLLGVDYVQTIKPKILLSERSYKVLTWCYYYLLIFAVMAFSVTEGKQFIYFQF